MSGFRRSASSIRKLDKEERQIVVKALRSAAKKELARGTGKGDQRLLHEARQERYRRVNDLATEFEQHKIG